ncbi:MAG: hypothetical protein MJA27_11150 [Pseudanabaenales cyanobacterium]|nr:hypothetical protein [Pseudanabaenales cyanobacterium]
MALKGYSIIDADAHVIEPAGMWAEYLEPEFKQFAPSAVEGLACWVSSLNPTYYTNYEF